MKKKVFIGCVLVAVVLFVAWYAYKERVKGSIVASHEEIVGVERS